MWHGSLNSCVCVFSMGGSRHISHRQGFPFLKLLYRIGKQLVTFVCGTSFPRPRFVFRAVFARLSQVMCLLWPINKGVLLVMLTATVCLLLHLPFVLLVCLDIVCIVYIPIPQFIDFNHPY